jgi:hypothetical protein
LCRCWATAFTELHNISSVKALINLTDGPDNWFVPVIIVAISNRGTRSCCTGIDTVAGVEIQNGLIRIPSFVNDANYDQTKISSRSLLYPMNVANTTRGCSPATPGTS